MGETSTAYLVAVLLLLALVAIAALFLMYVQARSQHTLLQAQFNDQVRDQFALWRDRELDAARTEIRQVAQAEARNEGERWRMETEANIRSDAIRRSTAVVTGRVGEIMTPYIGAFPYNPKDVRFIGSPIDLIVFEGLDAKDEKVRRIIFLEVKTGSGSLSAREREIRDAVREKRVEWQEFRLGT